MGQCEGLGDWLKCVGCEHICTWRCPFEGEGVQDKLMEMLMRAGKQAGRADYPPIEAGLKTFK